jgi:hypothetical protein
MNAGIYSKKVLAALKLYQEMKTAEEKYKPLLTEYELCEDKYWDSIGNLSDEEQKQVSKIIWENPGI